jgi:hypothetical protein
MNVLRTTVAAECIMTAEIKLVLFIGWGEITGNNNTSPLAKKGDHIHITL